MAQRNIDAIEAVQERAVRAIRGLNGTYQEKLASLNLPTVAARRERGDIIQIFKIVQQIYRVEPSNFFIFASDQHHYALRSAVYLVNDVPVPATNVVPKTLD